MSEVNWAQVVIEIVLLFFGFVIMYWKQRVEAEHRFTKLEVLVNSLGTDHEALSEKVSGISRNLAAVSGELKGCPHLHTQVGGHS